jgi:molybdate transport system ATP-binding protein
VKDTGGRAGPPTGGDGGCDCDCDDSNGAPPPGAGGARSARVPGAGLNSRLVLDRGSFRLDLPLAVAPGEVLALLGPNGAGKSTSLRALAGLAPLTGGHLRLDGELLEDPRRRLRVPPERRPVGVVFQDYLLFPHLSALDNVAFGPRCQGLGRARSRRIAADLLARMGLTQYAHTRPRRLSGGQAQRVALARALATGPRMLLLDEPLAALDARARLEVRAELRRHLAEFEAVAVLVTHDPLDAMVLADLLVVIEHGEVVQEGTPAGIARRPRSDYVARLVGLNLYQGRADGHVVTVAPGLALTAAETLTGPAFVAFAPSAVTLHRERPESSARNTWPAAVTEVESHGDLFRVALSVPGGLPLAADLTAVAMAELGVRPGVRVWAAVKAAQTHAYPA